MTEATGAAVRRDRGSRHTYYIGRRKCDGVTTILGDGIPKKALVGWAAREAASYAVDNMDTLRRLDREAAIDSIKGAPYRDRDAAANRGTEIHRLAMQINDGENPEVPDELRPYIEHYLGFLADFEVEPIMAEFVVVNRSKVYMGTGDLLARLHNLPPDLAPDGTAMAYVDLKTSRSGIFPETALQAVAYADAEAVVADRQEVPMPPVELLCALHLRADGYDLYPLLAEEGARERAFRMFLYAQQIARYFKRDGPADRAIGASIYPTPPTEGAA